MLVLDFVIEKGKDDNRDRVNVFLFDYSLFIWLKFLYIELVAESNFLCESVHNSHALYRKGLEVKLRQFHPDAKVAILIAMDL